MASQLSCSECGQSLEGRKGNAVTCSSNCRTIRARRLKAEHSKVVTAIDARISDPATQALRDAIRGHQEDAIMEAIQGAIGPVVRESLTDETLKAIHKLIGLTPIAVAAIMEDLTQTDSYDRRQKAYTLLMKYTAGHPALIPTVDPTPPAIVVNFPGMPRPAHDAEGTAIEQPEDGGEPDFICGGCGLQLPDERRAAPGAPQCGSCFAAAQARRDALMGGTA